MRPRTREDIIDEQRMIEGARRRNIKYLRIFGGLSLVIVVIGIVMMILDQSVVGHFSTSKLDTSTAGPVSSVSGFGVIFLGLVMLFCCWMGFRESTKKQKGADQRRKEEVEKSIKQYE